MPAPAPKDSPREEGFIIIEVLVSAIILALVAGAVLTLLTATTRSAASQRSHAVAYDLAQKDQARLRTMRLQKLKRLRETNTLKVGTTTYTVESRGDFLNNGASAISCGATNNSSDYIQLTSTISSTALVNPISIESVVSPSTGSLDFTHGTIVVQTTNAANAPVERVEAVLSNGTKEFSETNGCANFADLPANTNYNVTLKGNGLLITPEGKSETTTSNVFVGTAATTRVTGSWDYPGTLEPEFVYREPGTGELRPAPMDSMWVFNSSSGLAGAPFGTPGPTRLAPLVDKALYPFKSQYTVFAGACSTNNPDPNGTLKANDIGLASFEIPPKGLAKPRIYVPALELTVESATGGVVANASVTATDENSTCKFESKSVKHTFKTNLAGHLSSSEKGQTEAGLPFGTYKVCASAKISGRLQSKIVEKVSVQNLAAGTILKLKLAEGGSECT
jgi:type II secretory pathway pseudopilin PulG